MRVLKGHSKVVSGEVLDARSQAGRLLEAARLASEEARRKGYESGREEGRAEVTELLVRARADAERRRANATEDLYRLSVRIAERIIGRALEQAPETVVDIIRTALEAARSRSRILVKVHPEDLQLVLGDHSSDAIRWEPDGQISRGGCIIETEAGSIDARLEVQLAAIERALTENRHE